MYTAVFKHSGDQEVTMARKIWTVNGPITEDQVTGVLIHEHFGFGYAGSQCIRSGYNKEDCIAEAVKAIEMVKPYGINTVVDATPGDCGRDPLLLKEISDRTGMHIICITGFYHEAEGTFYFHYRQSQGNGVQEVYDMMRDEVMNGIGDTGIRAGIIKVSTGKDVISDYENMFLEATARLSREEDINIITHTHGGTMGSEQAKRMLALGVDPRRLMIGHLNNCVNIPELLKIFDQGVYGGFDRFGMEYDVVGTTDNEQYAAVMALLGCGYGKKILFSHDLDVYGRGLWGNPPCHKTSGRTWSQIFTETLPELKKRGVPDEQLSAFLKANAKEFLFAE